MTKTITRTIKRQSMSSPTKHLAIFGLSGYGKDVVGERIITTKVGKHKVIDLFSEERGEGMLYSMPNSDFSMKRRLEWMTSNSIKIKGFNNKIIMFLGNGLVDIPELPANIKLVTFSEDDVTNDDLVDFLAFNESQRGLLDMCLYNNRGKKMTFSSLERYLRKASNSKTPEGEEMKGAHRMTIFTLLRRIASIKSSGLFYTGDRDRFHNFDFEEVVNDKETITTFSTLLLTKEDQRGLALGILLKKILDMRKRTNNKIPVLFYIREMSYFYRDSSVTYYNLFKEGINKILREGRDLKFTCIINSQLPQDIPPYLFKQFNKVICLRVPDPRILLQKAMIDGRTMKKLSHLDEKGVGIYISSGAYRFPVFFPPTQHQKKAEGFDVFTYLNKKFGKIDYRGTQYLVQGIAEPKIETSQ